MARRTNARGIYISVYQTESTLQFSLTERKRHRTNHIRTLIFSKEKRKEKYPYPYNFTVISHPSCMGPFRPIGREESTDMDGSRTRPDRSRGMCGGCFAARDSFFLPWRTGPTGYCTPTPHGPLIRYLSSSRGVSGHLCSLSTIGRLSSSFPGDRAWCPIIQENFVPSRSSHLLRAS